jgi:hypothetical protein
MLCEFCHGKGLMRGDGGLGPCAECGGFGVLHCCEGLQAQGVGPGAAAGRKNRGRARIG